MANLALTTTEQLLSALRPNQTPAQWESDCVQAGIDWNDLAVRAIVLGLAPQLYRCLADWGLEPPHRALAKLAATYQAQTIRNAAIFGQLAELLARCRESGLQPIALKGVHLAALVYPEPGLRPMNDIDLLFEPHELPPAAELLKELAYGGKHKSAALGPGVTKHTSTYRRADEVEATPNPYLSPQAGRTVEPHTSLEESWFGLKVDITPGVRQRAVAAQLGDECGRVLANEDLLLHLSVHFTFHLIMGAPVMVQLGDLLTVTTRLPIEWAVFTERAASRRASPYALAGLNLAHKLLDAPVPEAALNALAEATPRPLQRRIVALELPDLMRRSQQTPLVTIRQRIGRGLADRAETARWAASWQDRWRVWRTAFQIGRSDTGRLILGK
jgi:hypothetical protein